MANDQQPVQVNLDMDAEVKARQQGTAPTSTDIAAQIGQTMREMGIDDEMNPLAAQKVQRDLDYQRQIDQLPQPDSAPLPTDISAPEVDRLEQLQKELDAAKSEATRWKKEFGRREGTVGQMKNELAELKARVSQIQPAINVQQITGREPNEPITAQDAVNLLMSQSSAFGNAMQALEERLRSLAANQSEPGLPLDMEAELVEAHPWLTDLPRNQKMRAMQDILASAGVTVTPPAPQAAPLPATLPAAARAPLRQVAFIEPSNKGSQAERDSVMPERQAYQTKVNQLAELLASLGAGPTDETQEGFLTRRR